MDTILQILGILGVGCIIVAYFQLQREVWTSRSLPYLAVNLMGSILMMLSFIPAWNLPGFIIEVFWFLITGYGLWRYLKKRERL
jgi:hypothetical protein